MSSLENFDLSLTPKDPGYRLMVLVCEKVRSLRAEGKVQNIKDVCNMIDIAPSHLTLLRNGGADTRNLSSDKIEAFAKFLNVPNIAIHFLSGKLSLQDFFMDQDSEAFQKEVHSALDMISNDKTWGQMMPADIYNASNSLQLYTIRLYEEATGKKLLVEGVDLGQLIQESTPESQDN